MTVCNAMYYMRYELLLEIYFQSAVFCCSYFITHTNEFNVYI